MKGGASIEEVGDTVPQLERGGGDYHTGERGGWDQMTGLVGCGCGVWTTLHDKKN